jgi:hypothetical protein
MNKSPEKSERRCPRLGGPISFGYCRQESGGRPCFKILDCWWEIFDVECYLRAELDAAEFTRLCEARVPSKLSGLIALIDRVRANSGGGEAG